MRARAFLVSERSPASAFTETVQAINYSFLYYANDQLQFWLAMLDNSVDDLGPYKRDATITGPGQLVSGRNKVVYQGHAAAALTLPGVPTPPGYSKSVWVNRATLVTGSLLGNAVEGFGFTAAGLTVSHGSQSISAPWSVGDGWHHVLASYDDASAQVALYIDGLLAASGVFDQRPLQTLTAFGGYADLADDLRLYSRGLTDAEVLQLYLGTRAIL